jgi:hypothetical protein
LAAITARARGGLFALARNALAVILEVGLETLEGV